MKFDLKKLNLRDKHTWLVLGLFGALLLVIALPADRPTRTAGQPDAGEEKTEGVQEEAEAKGTKDALTQLEQRLEETLSLVDGAGRVRVMITLKDNGAKVVEKDTSRQTGAGLSGEGGVDVSESSVYERVDGGEHPYVSNELAPQVEGVLVVAEGGGNSLVKQNILQSVMSLFPLEAHKITIVKMSIQEENDHENF